MRLHEGQISSEQFKNDEVKVDKSVAYHTSMLEFEEAFAAGDFKKAGQLIARAEQLAREMDEIQLKNLNINLDDLLNLKKEAEKLTNKNRFN